MPTVRDAAKRLRRAYSSGWFSPDTREDIGTILDYIERDIPPVPTQAYALEPGKHYVMAYDVAVVSSQMLAVMRENLERVGIHVVMLGIHGNPKDAIAFMPVNQTTEDLRDPMMWTPEDISTIEAYLEAEHERHSPLFDYLMKRKKEQKTDG